LYSFRALFVLYEAELDNKDSKSTVAVGEHYERSTT